ncbi:dihydropteroate synthase [Agaricicola taiwanensis]|uniref:Dihydropteroate synthase n=1 Tax=Agaricicola taiwanensis TaxID=591372 RepID=A0A8J2YEG9_9RHOB|nr:dihydropteroate synthase [Agaricicola taiwanensis]GGE36813.1 dihydropteroate synthase [Agaricicola taiwanensis]
MSHRILRARDRIISLDRTLVMGVVNVTPDSFSDGGRYASHDAAEARALALAAEGADILDLGGESSRPGHMPVAAEEEIARVVPVIGRLAERTHVPLSIDSWKASVAEAALAAGADIVNDIWGFQRDPDIARVTADQKAACVLMHNRLAADAGIDIMEDIIGFLSRSVEIALKAGVAEDRIVLDPGIGFGKTMDQNPVVITRLDRLMALGYPVLVGASRKRFIGHLTGRNDPDDRLAGTLSAHVAAALSGAHIIRAHDVAAHRDALTVADVISMRTT